MKKCNVKGMVLGAFALASTMLMGFTPMTAHAMANPEAEQECICEVECEENCRYEECEVCITDYMLCEGKEPIEESLEEEAVEEEEEVMGPLTPEGNLTLVDDYGTADKTGKQFITVVTKAGNYFYIIIDRDDNGTETVHFLNMVDESDLLALMEDEEAQQYMGIVEESEGTPEPGSDGIELEPDDSDKPVVEIPEEKQGGNKTGMLLLVVIVAVVGIGGFFFLKKNKSQKGKNIGPDPDFDYNEDEDDYLAGITEDEEIASEFDEEDEE